jgi:peptide deformylase
MSAPYPRPFVPYPHKVLRAGAAPVDAINDDIRALWDEMIFAMDAMPGVGLAAVQLGVPLALAVVDASNTRGEAVRMANPRVLHASAQMREHEEASPNLLGVSAVISRPRAVTVEFMNDQGAVEQRDFVGIWATSMQHQIDHLAGKMYFDHLSPLKRKMLMAKADKWAKRN